jgi:predicted dehydrogenase
MCADPDIDIIDVGTSPIKREQMVTTALNAGKHVMNEMPFAASLEGARKLVALQHAKGVKGGAGPSVVGMPHVALMKEMIEEGHVGELPRLARSIVALRPRPRLPPLLRARRRRAPLGPPGRPRAAPLEQER